MIPTIRVSADSGPSRTAARDSSGRLGRGWRAVRQLLEVVAVALLIGAALTILIAGRSDRPAAIFAVLSLISLCFAVAYVGVMRFALHRLLERTSARWQIALLHIAAVALAAMLGGEAAVRAIQLLGGGVGALEFAALQVQITHHLVFERRAQVAIGEGKVVAGLDDFQYRQRDRGPDRLSDTDLSRRRQDFPDQDSNSFRARLSISSGESSSII